MYIEDASQIVVSRRLVVKACAEQFAIVIARLAYLLFSEGKFPAYYFYNKTDLISHQLLQATQDTLFQSQLVATFISFSMLLLVFLFN